MTSTPEADVPEPEPAPPRLAATALVIRDDPFEVLMVRRSAGAIFTSAMVFPGGNIDPHDADPAWLPLFAGADTLREQALVADRRLPRNVRGDRAAADRE